MKAVGESFVFAGEEFCSCRYTRIKEGSLSLYFLRADGEKTVYAEGKDFNVDYSGGRICRTPDSAVPDFRTNPFYGIELFDHNEFAEYGNRGHTVYADYEFDEHSNTLRSEAAESYFQSYETLGLRDWFLECAGREINYVVFGDSISTGAEADSGKAYFDLLKAEAERLYGVKIKLLNLSVGGETSADGLKRWNDVLVRGFDLISIGYGMNDHNRAGEDGFFVSPEDYAANIRKMTEDSIKSGARVILLSPCVPNPLWKYSARAMERFSGVLPALAGELGAAYADVTSLWKEELLAGKSHESLLANDINHPNNYGHEIYFDAIRPILTN